MILWWHNPWSGSDASTFCPCPSSLCRPGISPISFRQTGSDHLKLGPPEEACAQKWLSVASGPCLMFLSWIVLRFTDPLIQTSDVAETKGGTVFNDTSDHITYLLSRCRKKDADENFDETRWRAPKKKTEFGSLHACIRLCGIRPVEKGAQEDSLYCISKVVKQK